MNVSFWKILSLAGSLAEELTKASADQKITVAEALHIIETICEELGIDFDKVGFDLAKKQFTV